MLSFDGHDFETMFIIGDPEISLFGISPNYVSVPGKNGQVVNGSVYEGSTVSFRLVATGNAAERRHKLSVLGSWLKVNEPKKLVLPDTPDRYYLAVPDGGIDLARGIGAEIATVTFRMTETASYGDTRTLTVNSANGAVTFNVDGSEGCPARPTITGKGILAGSGDDASYGLILDESKVLKIRTGTYQPSDIFIDCENRLATVNSNVAIPTLDSDWFEFEPGEHTLRVLIGLGGVTVKWRERWW